MFEPGDVVELKSGGPEMVVIQTMGSGVLCAWEVGAYQNKETGVIINGKAEIHWFHEDSIEHVPGMNGDHP